MHFFFWIRFLDLGSVFNVLRFKVILEKLFYVKNTSLLCNRFYITDLYITDRDGIVGYSDGERSVADASELPPTIVLHKRPREGRGKHREASSRLSPVAHHGAYS